jgi:hypothetical protein
MMFNRFGRIVFRLYEHRPITMNAIVGGAVYGGAECVAQLNSSPHPKLNLQRVGPISALGAFEVGGVMRFWYSALDRHVGMAGTTGIVLVKCALDQLFFATQGDGLFLALCAHFDAEDMPNAVTEVKRTFLTTWINDCAVWPLVNFVGFAAMPAAVLPTYMASMQLLWQLALSFNSQGASAGGSDEGRTTGGREGSSELSISSELNLDRKLEVPADDKELEQIFNDFDSDRSGNIDAGELRLALQQRGIVASEAEVKAMMRFGDSDGDGQVSLAEFKQVARSRKSNSEGTFWKVAMTAKKRGLEKGSVAALSRLKEYDQAKGERLQRRGGSVLEPQAAHGDGMLHASASSSFSAAWRALTTPYPESLKDEAWRRERSEAQRNCAVGQGLLAGGVIIRLVIFKM